MPVPSLIRLSVAQVNPVVGDLPANCARILGAYEEAAAQGAELVVFPELVLTGYPPEDLVFMPSFRDRALLALQELAGKTARGPSMLLGTVLEEHGHIYNAAVLLEGGKIAGTLSKTALPNYGVFDEKRVFSAGRGAGCLPWRGLKLGVLICEDVWNPEMAADCARQGAHLLVVINASPFEADKPSQRRGVCAAAAKKASLPLVYVNMVGGQDELVFDGASFALNADGMLAWQAPPYAEGVAVLDAKIEQGRYVFPAAPEQAVQTRDESIWNALVLGLHDYVRKNNFSTVLLGLSGGVDSAVSAAVAVDALGAERVKGVLLPSPYTSVESVEDAQESAQLLGIETFTVPINAAMETFAKQLSPMMGQGGWMEDVLVGGNLQARLRAVTLMALSNRYGWLLLSTGNKSELSVGYSTLYGDSCGGYNVLKDVYKTGVYQLGYWRNAHVRAIPQRSLDKAPSAELAPGQKDADQLPPYEVLDAILLRHIEERMSAEDIVAEGFDPATVQRVLRMVRLSEYKRRQGCPGVKISPMLHGRDRRYPLTNKF